MAKLSIQAGATSQSIYIFIQNSSVSTGAGLTGLVFNSASLTAYYVLNGAASVAITLATQTVTGAWSSGGFVEVDATHCPGLYRLDLPNAALASGRSVIVFLQGATNMAQCVLEIELTATNNQDAVRGGMTALPNANAAAAGGLFTRGTGAGQINQAVNGTVDVNLTDVGGVALSTTTAQIGVNVVNFGGTPQTALDIGAALPVKMTKNTALAKFPFYMNGNTGLTVSCQRSLDGGAFAACANAPVEISSGWYYIDLAASDLNANTVAFLFTAAGADPKAFTVVTQNA